VVIGLFLLDFFFYHGFVKNNLLSPMIICGIIIVAHLTIRFFTKLKLSNQFVITNMFFILPGSLLLSAIAYYLEEYGLLFPNYFFNNFQFHYISLSFIAIPAALFAAIHAGKSFWINQWKNVFFLLVTMDILGAGFLFYADFTKYQQLIAEDGLIEYLTALCFLVAGVISLLMIKKRTYFSHKVMRNFFMVGCIIVGVALIVVAGEEVSWGQRIFNIQTPDSIAAQNRQSEINLHNSELVWPYVYTAYAVIGVYGMLAWILWWLIKDLLTLNKQQQVIANMVIPGGYLFLNFMLISLYVWLREHHGPWKYQPWEEYAELILVIGILTHLIQSFISFPSKKPKK
jgi:hypothetical protein